MIQDDLASLAPVDLLSAAGRSTVLTPMEADRDLAWEPSALPTELREHAARALRWSLFAAAAARKVSDLQVDLRELHARLDAQARETLGQLSTRFTEAMVQSCIESHSAWTTAQRELHGAEAQARFLEAMCVLMRDRKELLIAAAALGRVVPGLP
jgi:hypothetical protein